MAVRIGSNISSLQAQRRLSEATSSLENTYQRLSSGLRINKASDDAAGLAIAEDLKVKGRVYTQAIRNGNDGLSVLNIADSALENLSTVVTRIRELAEQSANGTYSNTQRDALDKEAQALKQEYFRISKTTTFNGIKLFDGSLGDGLRLQLGFGATESINTSVGGAIGTGTMGVATSLTAETAISTSVAFADLNGDGILDLATAGRDQGSNGYATIRLGLGNGSFGSDTSYTTEDYTSNDIQLRDLNNDGILDLITAGRSESGLDFIGSATVRLGTGNGSFGSATSYNTEGAYSVALSLGDLNGDGILDLVTAGYSTGIGSATVRLGTGNGSFASATSYNTEALSSYAVTLGDLNGDGILDLVTAGNDFGGRVTVRLGVGNGTFGSATSYSTEDYVSLGVSLGDLNGDGILDLVTAGYGVGLLGYSTIRFGTGNGSFSSATSYQNENRTYSVNLGDLNGDGILDIITTGLSDNLATIRLGTGNGSFDSAISYATTNSSSYAVALGDINGDGVLDLAAVGSGGSSGSVSIGIGNFKDGLAPLLNFSLKTKAEALQSMGQLKRAQENLAKQRGIIGANQSRVGIAINNLRSSRENFNAAESRIRDADIAQETSNLIRTQILQKAASAVLAQANQAPQLAVTLLQLSSR